MAEAAPTLTALFGRFLRFGFMAWGGPVAQIAMIKRELVEEENWLTPQRFNRLLAVYQVLPGPEAHELCVHLGMMKRGRIGGILAGLGFMLPGFLFILALAWAYRRLDLADPRLAALFLGAQVGVIALIVRAVHRIAEHTLENPALWAAALASAGASLAGLPFWIVLPAAGLAYAAFASGRPALAAAITAIVIAVGIVLATGFPSAVSGPAGPTVAAGAGALFLSGLKAGLLTFGGAYTAIPFVRQDAVGRGWVTDGQFLDSLAFSGVIPAPLIIFATFVGYLAAGLAGALAITAGIFLPAFGLALLFYDRLERVIENERLHRLLEGVAAGVVGLIAVTAWQLGWKVAGSTPSLLPAILLFVAALATLYLWRSKANVPVAVVGSALLGFALFS